MRSGKREYRSPLLEECGSVRSLTRTVEIIGSELTLSDVGVATDFATDLDDLSVGT